MVVTNSQIQAEADLSAGARLRAKREELGLSIADVAQKIRLTREVLSALEAMDTESVPPSIVRLHASTYASFLKLPASEIASAYAVKKVVVEAQNLPESKLDANETFAQRLALPAIAAFCVLVFGAIGLVNLTRAGQETAELPVYRQVSTMDKLPETRAIATSLTTSRELSIRAVHSGWIEVRGSDGTVFRNRMMAKGEVYYPRVEAGWTVTLRNAGAFEWWLGEQRIALVGAYGESIYSLNIDEVYAEGEAALSTTFAAQ